MLVYINSFSKPDKVLNMSNMFSNLYKGLQRTRGVLLDGINGVFTKKAILDLAAVEDIETQLLLGDVGVGVTKQIVQTLITQLKQHKSVDADMAFTILKAQLLDILSPCAKTLIIPAEIKPYVILLVGVNGAGKTTTIGKLANLYKQQGKKVMLAAGDTFRAAAIEQLKIWGERNAVPVIAQKIGGDSAAVVYDALQAARAREYDVLIADTAGRLHTQGNLMEELKKIKRILQKLDVAAPHEVLLVLDATIGQNALNQAKQFTEAVGVTGLCLTKLDGTAKGGIVFAIAQQLGLPIRFIGVGESVDDLKPFNAAEFVSALFSRA